METKKYGEAKARQIRSFLLLKRRAEKAREAGDIEAAVYFENICERIKAK